MNLTDIDWRDRARNFCKEHGSLEVATPENAKCARYYTAEDFKKWGAQGGAKSKRVLTAAQAKAMVAAREKKRRKTKRVTRRANEKVSHAG